MEYFIVSEYETTPPFTDTAHEFVQGPSALDVLTKFRLNFPRGLVLRTAAVYHDANSYHRGIAPLLSFRSEEVIADD